MPEVGTTSELRAGPHRGHVMHAVTDLRLNLLLPTRTERGYVVAILSGALDVTRAPTLREQLLRLAAVRPAVGMAVRAAGLDRLLEIFPTVQSAVSGPARA